MSLDCIDVAIGKPAYQSSKSQWSGKYDSLCNYQKTHPEFDFHTQNEENPWWVVDLICIYPIHSLIIKNRKTKVTELLTKASSIKVEVSIDGTSWTMIHTGFCFFDDQNNPLTIPLLNIISARFIKLSLEVKNYFHLSEINVLVAVKDAIASEKKASTPKLIDKPHFDIDRLKVAILGTSNSLMANGYAKAIDNQFLEVVANIGLGSSHSTVIPQRIRALEDYDFDILIVDISVNEVRAKNIDENLYDLHLSRDIFYWLLSWCYKKNVIPIFILLPTKNEKSSGTKQVVDFYLDLFRDSSQVFFNGYNYIDDFSKFIRRSKDSLFSDANHLLPLYQLVMGSFISNQIFSYYLCSIKNKKYIRKIQSYRFYFLDFFDDGFDISSGFAKKTKRGSSLISESFLRLDSKDSFVLVKNINDDFGGDVCVVGICLNMAQTDCLVKINGYEKILHNSYYDPGRELWLVSWSLLNHVCCNGNILKVEITDTSNKHTIDVKAESNDHLLKKIKLPFDDVLEINGVVLRSKESFECVYFANDSAVDLNKSTIHKFYELLKLGFNY